MKVDFSDTLERIMQLEKELEGEIKKKNQEIIKKLSRTKSPLSDQHPQAAGKIQGKLGKIRLRPPAT